MRRQMWTDGDCGELMPGDQPCNRPRGHDGEHWHYSTMNDRPAT